MKRVKKIAIIPARLGSKRIKFKNIKKFNNKPIISWTIQKAINSKLFDRVIVSTDSIRIKKIAEKYKAEVPFLRSKKLSGDKIGLVPVVRDAIKKLRKNEKEIFYVCCILPTAVFLRKLDLKKGLIKLKKSKIDYVFSACSVTSTFRSFKLNSNGFVKLFFSNQAMKNSQNLTKSYFDAGQFYWGSSFTWLSKPHPFKSKSSIIKIPKWLNHDIDTMEDWENAKTIHKFYKEKN